MLNALSLRYKFIITVKKIQKNQLIKQKSHNKFIK